MSSLKWLSSLGVSIDRAVTRHVEAALSEPTPPGNVAAESRADLPRRTPGATISPAYLADLDEPIPYVPVSMGIDEYECPEAGCDFHVYAVGPDAAPGYLDDMRQEIDEHRRGHEDDRTAAEAIAPVSAPVISSPQAGVAALRFSHPAPLIPSGGAVPKTNPAPSDVPSLVRLDLREASARLDEAEETAMAALKTMPSRLPDAVRNLRAAIADYRAAVAR